MWRPGPQGVSAQQSSAAALWLSDDMMRASATTRYSRTWGLRAPCAAVALRHSIRFRMPSVRSRRISV